jgi:hypothetical protein
MNAGFLSAGILGLVATAVHGIAGELLVVRKLSPEALPSTRFGGGRMTMAMVHVSWHIATSAFLTVAVALLLAGTALDGDVAHAVGLMAAVGATGSAAVAMVLGGAYTPRALLRHGGPAALTVVAALAWLGVALA